VNAPLPRRRWRWFERWLTRRIPRARSITLDQRRIFIFPSRAGCCFLLSLLVMLVAAINYQNNLAFSLVFFLFSLFIVTILHTFANLSGLRLDALRAAPVFAGDIAEFEIQLSRGGARRYHSIKLGWPGQPQAEASLLDGGAAGVKLFYRTQRRGWLRPGRLRVQTEYPLGLLRAWTWIDLDLSALVYPRPLAGPRPPDAGGDAARGERRARQGSEEFNAFRAYRAGDNPRHVLWRAYAKGQPLQSTQFVEWQAQAQWLSWDDTAGGVEQRLGLLCHWVLTLQRRGELFGLRLPGAGVEPGTGLEHRERALRALALFGSPP